MSCVTLDTLAAVRVQAQPMCSESGGVQVHSGTTQGLHACGHGVALTVVQEEHATYLIQGYADGVEVGKCWHIENAWGVPLSVKIRLHP